MRKHCHWPRWWVRRAGFPGRFDNQSHAIDYCRNFFPWYNHGHRHSGIATLTPADVYLGAAQTMLNDRRCVLEAAYNKNPERFPLGMPQPADLPQAVYINPPLERQYRGDCSLNSTTKCLKVVDRFRHIPLIIVFGRFTTGIHVHIQLVSTLEGAGCINGTTLIDQQRAIDSSASPFFVAHTARHFVCFAQS